MLFREEPDRTDWPEALAAALGNGPLARDGLLLFQEEREDLSVRQSSGEDGPTIERCRTSGLAARGPLPSERQIYRADAIPDEAEPLAEAACNSGVALRVGSDHPCELRGPGIDADAAGSIVEALLTKAARHRPDAGLHASCIVFEQRAHIAAWDRPIVSETRRSCRIRLEARQESGLGTAVAESVLRADGSDSEAVVARLAEQVAGRLAERARLLDAPSGERSFVLAPGIGGILVHEIVGHALEGDTALAGMSWLAHVSVPVASPELLVIDDPRRGRAGWRYDDEGHVSRATPLVRDGKVAGWLVDRRTSQRSQRPVTGHGRRSSFREPIKPRMGCTFIAAGRLHAREVLHGTDEGIYVRRMESASTDPLSGHALFRVTDSDWIKNGRVVGALAPHLMAVDAKQVLPSIDRIGNDIAFDTCIGSCTRDGQPLATSVGAPTIRIGLANALFAESA